MAKRSFSQDDRNRILNSNSPTPKIENVDSPETSLRADMVPGSQAIPAERNKYERIKGRLFYRLILGAMILAGIWFLLTGQGRRTLESELIGLIASETQVTRLISTAPLLITSGTPTSSITPTAAIPRQPTVTLIVVNLPTRTHTPVINRSSPTPTLFVEVVEPVEQVEPECREALTITLEDVGRKMCVQGTVANIINNTTNTMVIFSAEQSALYWVTYDLVWVNGEIGKCYQIDGTINQILNNPVLVFNYRNLPKECP